MFSTTLSDNANQSLALLGNSKILSFAYMAGGSALALQFGHRLSEDFDFFSQDLFDSLLIKKQLDKLGSYQEEHRTPKTMVGQFNKTRFSLFHYPYQLIAATEEFNKIKIASSEDIAAMKLVAITDRGTKKDYIDLYFLAQHFSLDKMLEFYDKKYHLLETNKMILLKSLQYFIDADLSEMPKMLKKINWNKIKDFFRKESLKLWQKMK